jgi:uncharacterized protein involved in high-affinity Fe2+ transport
MKKRLSLLVVLVTMLTLVATAAVGFAAPGEKGFQEYPLGDEKEVHGLVIAGVYFQPVDMEPAGMGLTRDQADMHMEADISAGPENKYGFGVGDFVPFLSVNYRITKLDTGAVVEGSFMPMNASDGPHYGANIKLLGAGRYKVEYIIDSPERTGYMLHTDKETGVEGRFWTTPIVVDWEFDWIPRSW